MQAVGFGVMEGGLEYAIVRNQWGTDWADNGFINVYLDKNSSSGVCGIYLDAYNTLV